MAQRLSVLVGSWFLIAALLVGCSGTSTGTAPTATSAPATSSPKTPAPAATGAAATVAPTKPAAPAKELKIGTLSLRSGAAAPYGIAHGRAVDLAVDDVNAAGGIKVGNDTYKLKAVHEDDKMDSAASGTAANKLFYEDQVKFLLVGSSISGLASWAAVAGPNKLVQFNSGVGAGIMGTEKPSSFRTMLSANETSVALYSFLKKKFPGKTRLAIVVWNNPTGVGGVPGMEAAAAGAGFTVVAKELTPIPTTDFVPVLNKILPQKPDFIHMVGAPAEAGLLLKQSKAMGWDGPLLMGNSGLKELFEIGGKENVNDRYFGVGSDYTSPLATKEGKAANEKYQQKYGEPLTELSVSGYNQVMILKAALEKAGNLDTDKVISALESLETLPTLDGPGRFGGAKLYNIKRQLFYPTSIGVARDGKWEVIDRMDVASFYQP